MANTIRFSCKSVLQPLVGGCYGLLILWLDDLFSAAKRSSSLGGAFVNEPLGVTDEVAPFRVFAAAILNVEDEVPAS